MFYNLTNLIKISTKYKKKKFIVIKNKNNLNLARIYIKLNIIKFIKIEDKHMIISLNYNNNKNYFNNLINLYKPSMPVFMKLKFIKYLNAKKNWIFILSTNKGVITNYECVNYNIGGLLISKLWN